MHNYKSEKIAQDKAQMTLCISVGFLYITSKAQFMKKKLLVVSLKQTENQKKPHFCSININIKRIRKS